MRVCAFVLRRSRREFAPHRVRMAGNFSATRKKLSFPATGRRDGQNRLVVAGSTWVRRPKEQFRIEPICPHVWFTLCIGACDDTAVAATVRARVPPRASVGADTACAPACRLELGWARVRACASCSMLPGVVQGRHTVDIDAPRSAQLTTSETWAAGQEKRESVWGERARDQPGKGGSQLCAGQVRTSQGRAGRGTRFNGVPRPSGLVGGRCLQLMAWRFAKTSTDGNGDGCSDPRSGVVRPRNNAVCL